MFSILMKVSTTTGACSETAHEMVNQVNHELLFGKKVGGNPGNYMEGAIDEILIYEVVLSAAEVTNLYNSFA